MLALHRSPPPSPPHREDLSRPPFPPPSHCLSLARAESSFFHPLNGDHQCALVACTVLLPRLIVILAAISPAGEQTTTTMTRTRRTTRWQRVFFHPCKSILNSLPIPRFSLRGRKRRDVFLSSLSRNILISDKSGSRRRARPTRFRLLSRRALITTPQ